MQEGPGKAHRRSSYVSPHTQKAIMCCIHIGTHTNIYAWICNYGIVMYEKKKKKKNIKVYIANCKSDNISQLFILQWNAIAISGSRLLSIGCICEIEIGAGWKIAIAWRKE